MKSKMKILQIRDLMEKDQDGCMQNIGGDFTNTMDWWSSFYSTSGFDSGIEWSADFPEFRDPLVNFLLAERKRRIYAADDVDLLIPGCGISGLSQHLFELGFKTITSVDFSSQVIDKMSDSTPLLMKWLVSDISDMPQFAVRSFEAVVDKAALDFLMHDELNPLPAYKYISEVSRILSKEGRFCCISNCKPNVLGLLFSKFRFCKFGIKKINHVFLILIEKFGGVPVDEIPLLDISPDITEDDGQLYDLIQAEINIRMSYNVELLDEREWKKLDKLNDRTRATAISLSEDPPPLLKVEYALEDIIEQVRGDPRVMRNMERSRIIVLLGEPGKSRYCYQSFVYDRMPYKRLDVDCFYSVTIYPKRRFLQKPEDELLDECCMLSWSRGRRIIVVFLDSSSYVQKLMDHKAELEGLLIPLCPDFDFDPPKWYIEEDGIAEHVTVYTGRSDTFGEILVEDILYDSNSHYFRRLIFLNTPNLVQTEVRLSKMKRDETKDVKRRSLVLDEIDGRFDFRLSESDYHVAIIATIMLLSLNQKGNGDDLKVLVIGLGGGALPMSLKTDLHCAIDIKVEVVEIDGQILQVAKDVFYFEDDDIKVTIMDGVQFILSKFGLGYDVLVVDVFPSNPECTFMTSPDPSFLEESVLRVVYSSLNENGIFMVNFVSRSAPLRLGVYSRLLRVFRNVLKLELEPGLSEVLIGVKCDRVVTKESLLHANEVLKNNSLALQPTFRDRLHSLGNQVVIL